jgi:hypothetical protein
VAGPGDEPAAASQAQGEGHPALQAQGEEQGARQDQYGTNIWFFYFNFRKLLKNTK